jgi:hypothetical protein
MTLGLVKAGIPTAERVGNLVRERKIISNSLMKTRINYLMTSIMVISGISSLIIVVVVREVLSSFQIIE